MIHFYQFVQRLAYSISLLLLLAYGQANAQNYVWAKSMGGTSSERGHSVVADASGNVYTLGSFQGATVDFDPNAGIFNLTPTGAVDIFIQKLDASGNLVWAKKMGGTGVDYGQSITVDASGNIYATGRFQNTVDFDPNAGTTNLTSLWDQDIFVQKLDASGNLIWAKSMGGTSYTISNSIVTDASNNIYIAGYFAGTVDFDPNAGTAYLTSAGINDSFICKLDASGNYVWAKSIGSTDIDESACVKVDASGNVYTVGYFHGTVDFDPNAGAFNLTSAGNADIFVQKLNASGNLVWAKRMGDIGDDRGTSIDLDALGNVYSTGYFQGTVDFDPNAGIFNLTCLGSLDIIVQKLDASGNLVWAKSMGGTNLDYATSIKLDASGNVYTTGYFQGTSDFDPGVGTANLTFVDYTDIFISKLDASGNYVWAGKLGGASYDTSYSIAIDASNNIYIAGYFGGVVDFDPGAGTANLTAVGNEDIFVSKLSTAAPEINLKQNTASIASAGSYDFGAFTVGQSGGNITFTIENTGDAALNLTGNPKIVKSGANTSDFIITETLPATINTSGSATFTINFTPSGVGTRTAQISIANNDNDENPYIVNLTGAGKAPEINLKQNTASIASAGSYDFGAFTVGQSSGNITFTIENIGDAALNLTGNPKIVKSGANASDFIITETLPATINASGSATFTINFTPSGTGTRTAQISIANNDNDENPYIVNLTGGGNILPCISKGIYPNPAKDMLTISVEGNPVTEIAITLFDEQGKACLVCTLPVEGCKAHLPLQTLASGLYLLHMQVGKEWITEKVVVVR